MKRALLLSLLLVFTATGAFAEVTVVTVQNPDNTITSIFYREGKEVGRQIKDSQGKVTKKTGKIPEGSVKQYIDTGELEYEWNYKDGRLEGISKAFYISGELLEEMLYKNNVREGISRKYYKDGKLLGERNFKNDQLEGLTRMFFENGKVFAELHYKEGKLDGESRMYFEDGKLRVIETYRNHEKTKMKAFDSEGNVVVDHDFTAETTGAAVPPAQPKDGKAAEKPMTTVPPAPPAQPKDSKAAEKPPVQ